MSEVVENSMLFRRRLVVAALCVMAAVVAADVLTAMAAQAGAAEGMMIARTPDAPAMPDPDPFGPELPGRGKFLVASNGLGDPRFQETVVLLIEYGANGATGIIINRPSTVSLSRALPLLQGLKKRSDVIYYGGPVEGKRLLMLIRSHDKPEDSGSVFDDVFVSVSRKTLERMVDTHKTGKQFKVYAGYAGWVPRQLDAEIARGDWLIVSADARSIFEEDPSRVWLQLFRRASAIQVRNRRAPMYAVSR